MSDRTSPRRRDGFTSFTRGGTLIALALALVLAGRVSAQDTPPQVDPSDVLDTLLAGFLGFKDVTGEELEKEVAEVGEVPFRTPVALDFLDKKGLATYLQEVFDAEYPQAKADADQRMLQSFGLLRPGTDLRRLRAKLLEDNVVGFYDDRPGKKRLYAVSANHTLTPSNQIILSHELRHALQDQYMDTHSLLDDSIGDFDDRHMALLCLLEGDATFLMERFLVRQLPDGEGVERGLQGALPEAPDVDAPPVVRDELVRPYTAGLEFVRALFERGGWAEVRRAWDHPPTSTEQVLNPAKYFDREDPRRVDVGYAPSGSKVVSEGVLGEMLARPLLGDEEPAPLGWRGDAFRVYDVSGKTLLVWRALWRSGDEGRAFLSALNGRLKEGRGQPEHIGSFEVYRDGAWRFAVGGPGGFTLLVSSDDLGALLSALRSLDPGLDKDGRSSR